MQLKILKKTATILKQRQKKDKRLPSEVKQYSNEVYIMLDRSSAVQSI